MAIPSTYLRRLTGLFLASKALFLLVAFTSGLYIFPYVNNTDLILLDADGATDALVRRLLAPFARWDGTYFLKIAADGYQFEHQHAFFPLFPLVTRAAAKVLKPLTCLSLLTRCMLAGVIIANLAHFLTALNIFRLTRILNGGGTHFAYVTAAFVLIGPAFPFQSAIYTESLFSLLVSTGMFAYYSQQHLLGAVCWCLSGLTRSNGVLLAGFFAYDALKSFAQGKDRLVSLIQNICSHNFKPSQASSFKALVCISTGIAGFVAFQTYGYLTYCGLSETVNRRPWCVHSIPDLYSFVQYHYWNVRPWKYYTLGQIPNFLIAAPTSIICIIVCVHYIRIDPFRFFTLGLGRGRTPSSERALPFINQDFLLPHIVLMLFMLAYTAVLVHVQIIARLFSFQPLLYWALAHFYLGSSQRMKRIISYYALGYAAIGSILFVNFYPPA